MAFTRYNRTRRRGKSSSTESPADALARIEASQNASNYPAIVSAFAARGIPAEQVLPRENVFTYRAWQAKGRQVKRGEKSVKIDVWIEYEKKPGEGAPAASPAEKCRARRSVAVFHISQTEAIPEGAALPASRPAGDIPEDDAPQRPAGGGASPAPSRGGVSSSRLRDLADNMQSKIDAKLSPAIASQNYTRRRAAIAEGMRRDAYRLQDVQRARRKMADAIDNGTLPEFLRGVYSESDLMTYTREVYAHEKISDAERSAREWLSGNFESDADKAARESYEAFTRLQNDILASPPDGYFPTPASLARRMVEMLDIQNGDEILEPSAGTGSLCEACVSWIAEHSPQVRATITVVEQNGRLCEVLRHIGFEDTYQADIMTVRGEVDRVIMNPPYENKQDIRHVRHCFEMLKPGGRLVALISCGWQFRADNETCEFREWLQRETVIDSCEVLEDAFKGPESKRQTGVRVTLISLSKRGAK
jgi:protein-L-isoaspartate O-methyltransferase